MKCASCHREHQDDAEFCPYCGEKIRRQSEHAEFEYAAFISYRHLPRDQEVAKQVQQAIETFKMPRGISAWKRSDQKLGKCFRDEDELAAAHSLPDRILEALEKSSSLIVICSPDARESIWVKREVEAFVEMHGRKRVFPVLASGSSTESIPEFLQSGYASANNEESHRSNPLAADMRPEASDKIKEETLRIIAAVAGCGFDDLRQRDKARRRKRLFVTATTTIAVVALMALMIALSVQSNRQAQLSESYKLAKESTTLLERGDRYGAIEKALEALPDPNSPFQRPLVEDARQALIDALEIELIDQPYWRPSYLIELENDVKYLVTAPDYNWFAVLDSSIGISTYECTSGKKLATFSPMSLIHDESNSDIDSMPSCWRMATAGNLIIVAECAGSGVIAVYDAMTGQLEWEYSPLYIRALTTSLGGEIVDFFVLGDGFLCGLAEYVKDGKFVNGRIIENEFDVESNLFFIPITADDNGMMYVGAGNRIIGFNFAEEDTPTVTSDAKDLEVYSICQIQDEIITSSTSQINTEAKSWTELEREYRFEALNQEAHTLWSFSGTWMPKYEGEGRDLRTATGEPKVHGAANLDRTYAICTVGDSLLLLDISNGELSYTEQFGSTIISAGKDGLIDSKYGDIIVVACADGTINFRHPFIDREDGAQRLSFSFPGYIWQSFVGWTSENMLMAVAVSHENQKQVYGYHLDTKGLISNYAESSNPKKGLQKGLVGDDARYIDFDSEFIDKPVSAYSLEELIALGHQTLAEGGRE